MSSIEPSAHLSFYLSMCPSICLFDLLPSIFFSVSVCVNVIFGGSLQFRLAPLQLFESDVSKEEKEEQIWLSCRLNFRQQFSATTVAAAADRGVLVQIEVPKRFDPIYAVRAHLFLFVVSLPLLDLSLSIRLRFFFL